MVYTHKGITENMIQMVPYFEVASRYKSILIDADEYLTAVVRYIHLNPVEAGIVRRPQGYKWSSHSFYMQPYLAPGWLKVGEVLERFASIREFNQFVLSGNEDTVNEFYNSSRLNPILGGESFIKLHKGSLSKVSREYPRY